MSAAVSDLDTICEWVKEHDFRLNLHGEGEGNDYLQTEEASFSRSVSRWQTASVRWQLLPARRYYHQRSHMENAHQ